MPRVSVVMPAYNCGPYIRQAVDSVLAQTEPDLEVVVVDDGSTDQTPEILRSLARVDPRVRVVTQPNSGKPAIARNRGIRESNGDVISFLDADDLWWPEKLRSVLAVLDTRPDVGLVFHDVEVMGADGVLSGRRYLAPTDFAQQVLPTSVPLPSGAFLCDVRSLFFFICTRITTIFPSAAIIRRARLLQEPVFFAEDVVAGEDADLWFRIVKTGGIAYLDQALSGYRIHGQSVTSQAASSVKDPGLILVRNYGRATEILEPAQLRAYRHRIAADLRSFAWRRAREGLHGESLRWYTASLSWEFAMPAVKGILKSATLEFARRARSRLC